MSRSFMQVNALLLVKAALLLIPGLASANLITNGDFDASNSTTTTPTGWTQIGLEQGVMPYSMFPEMPIYESGPNFYDLGGINNPVPNPGDGIEQTVSTLIGTTYTLSFGLSSEDGTDPPEDLNVLIDGSTLHTYTLVSTFDPFTGPWVTETLDFTATSASTTVAFTVDATEGMGNADLGNNDPLLAEITLNPSATSSVPEPSAGWIIAAGFGAIALWRRRRAAAVFEGE
jgi:MYXO-CTERM domain-containing protein